MKSCLSFVKTIIFGVYFIFDLFSINFLIYSENKLLLIIINGSSNKVIDIKLVTALSISLNSLKSMESIDVNSSKYILFSVLELSVSIH